MQKRGLLIIIPFVVAGCQSSSSIPGNTGNPQASGHGASVVQVHYGADAGLFGVAEIEPNDWAEHSQYVGEAQAGRVFHIHGSISPGENDTYRFHAVTDLDITWRLIPSQASKFFRADIGLIDYQNFTCSIEGISQAVFSECQPNAQQGLRTGTTVSAGMIELAVTCQNDNAHYILEIEFWGASQSGESAESIHAKANELLSSGCKTAPATLVSNFEDNDFIICFEKHLSREVIETRLSKHDLRLLQYSPSGLCRIGLSEDGKDTTAIRQKTLDALSSANAISGVRYVEANRLLSASSRLMDFTEILPNDNMFNLQQFPTMLQFPEAWSITTGSPDVVIAMLDTGVLFNHPDLGGRLLPGYDFVSSTTRSKDGDGYDPDPTDPGESNESNSVYAWHGTHTTGIVGAVPDNAIGICGATWSCKIMPVRVLGAMRKGSVYDLSEAIRFAAGLPNASGTLPTHKANVINMSLDSGAGSTAPTAVGEACRDAWEAGAVVIAASGNQGSSDPSYPAAFANCISVGALRWNRERASFSNYGSTLELCAPTGDSEDNSSSLPSGVLSTVAANMDNGLMLEYAYREGTSMACPQVSGIAGLMLSVNPELTPDQVRTILRETATDLGESGKDDEFGYGMVNAFEAVARAAATEGTRKAGNRPSLSACVLDFSQETTDLSFVLQGIDGSAPASLPGVVVTKGAEWLTARIAPVGPNDTEALVYVSADRSSLAKGQHNGIIEISSSGQKPQRVDAYVTKENAYNSPDEIFVVAIHPETGDSIARSGPGTTLINTTTYKIEGLQETGCYLIAGTDRDGNGIICEDGDACGAWPNLGHPEVVLESDLAQNTPSITVYEIAPGGSVPYGSVPIP